MLGPGGGVSNVSTLPLDPAVEQQLALDLKRDAVQPRNGLLNLLHLPPDSLLPGPAPDPDFVQSIREWMICTPIIVRLNPKGGPYEVIDGRNRIAAARLLVTELFGQASGGVLPNGVSVLQVIADKGLDPIAARIYPPGYSDADVMGWVLNDQRRDNLCTDLATIEKWLARPYVSEEILARRILHCPVATLRRKAKLLRLSDPLRAALQDRRLRPSTAYQIASLSAAKQTELADLMEGRADRKLHLADVAAVRRVQEQAALESLEDDLFNVPAPAAGVPQAPAGAPVGYSQVAHLLPPVIDLVELRKLRDSIVSSSSVPNASWVTTLDRLLDRGAAALRLFAQTQGETPIDEHVLEGQDISPPSGKTDRVALGVAPETRERLISLLFTDPAWRGKGYTDFLNAALDLAWAKVPEAGPPEETG